MYPRTVGVTTVCVIAISILPHTSPASHGGSYLHVLILSPASAPPQRAASCCHSGASQPPAPRVRQRKQSKDELKKTKKGGGENKKEVLALVLPPRPLLPHASLFFTLPKPHASFSGGKRLIGRVNFNPKSLLPPPSLTALLPPRPSLSLSLPRPRAI